MTNFSCARALVTKISDSKQGPWLELLIQEGPLDLKNKLIRVLARPPLPSLDHTLAVELSDQSGTGFTYRLQSYKSVLIEDKDNLLLYLASVLPHAEPDSLLKLSQVGTDFKDYLTNEVSSLPLAAAEQRVIAQDWLVYQKDRSWISLCQLVGFSQEQLSLLCTQEPKFLNAVKTNPYLLVTLPLSELALEFSLIEELAKVVNYPVSAAERSQAALLHLLNTASNTGHCWQSSTELLPLLAKLTGYSNSLLSTYLEQVTIFSNFWLAVGGNYWLRTLFEAEALIARRVRIMLQQSHSQQAINWQTLYPNDLSAEQQQVIETVLRGSNIELIGGGPGTGKSSLLDPLIKGWQDLGYSKIILTAPTGKAARRMTEVSGHAAHTIHLLLKQGKLAKAEVVIVDESSMLDTLLFAELLSSLNSNCRLLLLGDVDQLPPVRAGRVWPDLLQVLPSQQLATIYRQRPGSQILTLAHAIRAGNTNYHAKAAGGVTYLQSNDPVQIRKLVLTTFQQVTVGANFPLVLAPHYAGPNGIDQLNLSLQAARHQLSGVQPVVWQGGLLAVGDPVIWLHNNYKLGLVNGYQAIIEHIEQRPHLQIDLKGLDGQCFSLQENQLDFATSLLY